MPIHAKRVTKSLIVILLLVMSWPLYRHFKSNSFAAIDLAPTARIQAFYYGWYGSPATDGQWLHWNSNNHVPPDDIDSTYYPELGAYSSQDRAVVAQQMAWASKAGVGTLIYSWWGRGNYIDHNARLVLEEAAKQNIKVSWILEPYAGRTPASVVSDIHYLYDTYGNYPAFFRVSRSTKYGNTTAARGVFYIFQSNLHTATSSGNQWRPALDGLHTDAVYNGIVLGFGEDACYIDGCNDLDKESHFDGMFLYAGSPVYALGYPTMKAALDARNSIFVPTVVPGFNSSRDRAGDAVLPRYNTNFCANRYTYDCTWDGIIQSKPEWMSITSFNEWHESTNIEPAVIKSISSYTYKNYADEALNATSSFYLDKTATNVVKYLAALGISWSPPVATSPGSPSTATNSSASSGAESGSSSATGSHTAAAGSTAMTPLTNDQQTGSGDTTDNAVNLSKTSQETKRQVEALPFGWVKFLGTTTSVVAAGGLGGYVLLRKLQKKRRLGLQSGSGYAVIKPQGVQSIDKKARP